ncbi:MAG: hypothetical protein JNK82_30550, partial [Myxococcaceae bacterium]|nr:hypothetical protein [Myxococcaceae bacterium]
MLLAAVGCSGGGGGSITLDDMPAEASKVLCTKAYECCTPMEASKNQQYGPDQASCETKVRSGLDLIKNFTAQGETKGRVTYDGVQMKACLDVYAKKTCAELKRSAGDMLAECTGAFEPQVAVGGVCNLDTECISSACQGGSINVEGVCKARVAAGADCEEASCIESAYCRSGSLPDGGF